MLADARETKATGSNSNFFWDSVTTFNSSVTFSGVRSIAAGLIRTFRKMRSVGLPLSRSKASCPSRRSETATFQPSGLCGRWPISTAVHPTNCCSDMPYATSPKCIDRMEQELTGSQRHQEFVTAEDSRFQPLIHNFCIERHSHSGVSDKPMRRERLIPG